MDDALFSSESSDWETPDELVSWAYDHFFPDRSDQPPGFSLDPCATEATNKALKHFDRHGLETDWYGRVWMNPPYGRDVGQWVGKAVIESLLGHCDVVALLPVRTDTRWWQDWVKYASKVVLLKGRVTFVGANASAPFPSALILFPRRVQSNVPTYYTKDWKHD